jgi:hypothetical protein
LKHQKCNGQRNKDPSYLITETDDSKNYNKALSAERNVTEDFSGLKRAAFGLCTWHLYGGLFKCTEVLDVVELDLWSSEYHAGFLFKYHLYSPKIPNNLQRCSDFIITAERSPFVLPQT